MPTDWNNIDLNLESHLTMLDDYTFDALLLEVNCNLREINEATVTAQFLESLESKVRTAKEIFYANRANIVKHAKQYRESE